MHVGHCRGAVVGDALANLLTKAGFGVTKEYLINDAGAQVIALAWAAYWRYLQAIGTPLSEEVFAAEAGGLQYSGDYLVPVGEALAARHGTSLAGPRPHDRRPRGLARDGPNRDDRGHDGVDPRGSGPAGHRTRRVHVRARAGGGGRPGCDAGGAGRAGLIYRGILEPPKGKTPEDWEPREQMLFRSTRFGDDVDRPLRKSDGSNTYFTNDIAYHADRLHAGRS